MHPLDGASHPKTGLGSGLRPIRYGSADMGFRLLGWEWRGEASTSDVAVSGLMGESAASLREVVVAADRAVHELQIAVDSSRSRRGGAGEANRSAVEAEIARTLLQRAEGFRKDAAELLAILERAAAKLGPGDAGSDSPQAMPFARRSTDPGGAERLKGAPPSTWRGPERRGASSDAKMPDGATGNGKPMANEGAS